VEQRRVALARALCGGPRLLLIDEPTAGVDAERRDGLRALILRAQREWRITTIVATHEPAEAAELGERLALMIEGRVIQHDGPERVFLEPASPAVARFLGSRNLLGGEARDGQLDTDAGVLAVPGPDGPADFTIRPERVRLRPDGHLRMRVDEAAFVGSGVRVRLSAGELRLEALVDPAEAPPAGEIVRVDCPLDALWRFPQQAAGLARPSAAGAYST
jgi:ABC-type sulfate/molybdate transport systems ATPase subunit